MKSPIQFALIVVLLAACNEVRGPSGVYRPGKFGVEDYVKTFPTMIASKQEVIDFVGVPDKTFSDGGVDYFTYKIWGEGAYGLEMTYAIKDGAVIDVISKETTMAWGTTSFKHSVLVPKSSN